MRLNAVLGAGILMILCCTIVPSGLGAVAGTAIGGFAGIIVGCLLGATVGVVLYWRRRRGEGC